MKTYSILGDSISTFKNSCVEGYSVFYDEENCKRYGITNVDHMWWSRVISSAKGKLLVNASYSGSMVAGADFPSGNSCRRIEDLYNEKSPDVILVYMGLNDYSYSVPVRSGNPEMYDEDYFFDSYCIMLWRLRQTYPDAEIICGTLMKNYISDQPSWKFPEKNKAGFALDDYNDAIREACELYGAKVADLAATGKMCDTLDGSHGTLSGQRQLANAWMKCIG